MNLRALFATTSLLGCSGDDQANFTGAPWNITASATVLCDGGSPITPIDTTTLTFTAVGSGLGSTSIPSEAAWLCFVLGSGGPFRWSLGGDIASLSTPSSLSDADGSVECSPPGVGGSNPFIVLTSYTATTSDGHHLTMNGGGFYENPSGSSAYETCTFGVAAIGTR